jgi:XRE family transcriptional regulator, regulator of sulfur utilization
MTEVADATEISSSFLSLFETGKCDITFGRLVRLVDFFGVSITDLIPDPEPQQTVVVHREHRRHLQSRSERATAELLAHHTRHKMLPVLVALEPGGRIVESFDREGGERFLFVLRGQVEVDDRENEPIRLRPGDAAYYLTNRPRTFRNVGRTRAEWVSVEARKPV